ncbi:AraC family transcriptional regulator [Methylophaga sp. OBS1]|jgi:AraC-like DNA-binding protein|uniref:AraC family transcriptional regulator n=1 Tax=Methylophaga sp. OBS1 TaxID=2991933 RepID=UPI00224FD73A|nr:helix-turn-helix domain-containing protein [Methylophaga sp. OBS1]MCX4191123.1 AraC family transcriptional regulator [Methylophaga sp. OBS1]MCX4191931.1 AraC family transcriptional regulator [Methylophaga sp. OBS1]
MQIEKLSLSKRREKRQLLIENKLQFAGPDSALSIYDTYRAATGVGLAAEQLLFCGMVSGRKVMHDLRHQDGELFLPHESYVMPPGDYVEIDFPDAKEEAPTTCLTIEISKDRISDISERMRDLTRLEVVDHSWEYQPKIIHTHHTTDTQQLLEKMVSLYTQNNPDKEIMLDLGVTELVIRLLREQGREVLLSYCQQDPDATGVTAAIHYLEQNLTTPLDVDQLCRRACMSRSRLYVEFKKQLGCTPGEFQQQLRLKSAAEAIRAGKSVTDACYSFGFNDLSHFSRRFTRFFGCSPSQYRLLSGNE